MIASKFTLENKKCDVVYKGVIISQDTDTQ